MEKKQAWWKTLLIVIASIAGIVFLQDYMGPSKFEGFVIGILAGMFLGYLLAQRKINRWVRVDKED